MIRILLVEDEGLHSTNLREMILEQFPQIDVVETAENGRQAVQKVRELRPQLVFMDIEMPVMDGLDAAAIIKKQFPDTHIIFLTAYNRFEYAVGAMRAGGEDYLLKPYHRYEVAGKITQVLGLQGGGTGGEESGFAHAVQIYIKQHCAEDISLESAAEAFSMSSFYFSRLFKAQKGKNFTDYLIRYRVDRAAELLLQTDIPVKDVGQLVGYPDSNYFTKVFKRITGRTPTAYRAESGGAG